MIYLALDTSFKSSCISLANDSNVIAEVTLNQNNEHVKSLLPSVDFLLSQCNILRDSISRIIVTTGPGNITGIRVGISTAQGLSLGLNIPIIRVDTSYLLAMNVLNWNGIIWVIINAYSKMLYASSFFSKNHVITRLTNDKIFSIEDICSLIKSPALLIGNGTRIYWNKLYSHNVTLGNELYDTPNPGMLASLGKTLINTKYQINIPEMLQPTNYDFYNEYIKI